MKEIEKTQERTSSLADKWVVYAVHDDCPFNSYRKEDNYVQAAFGLKDIESLEEARVAAEERASRLKCPDLNQHCAGGFRIWSIVPAKNLPPRDLKRIFG